MIDLSNPPMVAAVVIAVLDRDAIRVLIGPGVGQLDGGVEVTLPTHLVPPSLRVPSTRIWLRMDKTGSIVEARPCRPEEHEQSFTSATDE